MFVNPRFGSRRCSGIWPPSKPGLIREPARDRWPFEPRVAVFPCPEPMPWPMRLRRLEAPRGGRSVPMCVAIEVALYFLPFFAGLAALALAAFSVVFFFATVAFDALPFSTAAARGAFSRLTARKVFEGSFARLSASIS